MENVYIVYSSRTGFTKQYAQWLAEDLHSECTSLSEYCPHTADAADTILCAGGVYGNEIHGIRQFKRIRKQKPQKQILFLATGIRPVSAETLQRLLLYNFSKADTPELFYVQGGLNLETLPPAQRTMLSLFRAMLKHRRDLSESDHEILRLLETSGDYSHHTQIETVFNRISGDNIHLEGGVAHPAFSKNTLPI